MCGPVPCAPCQRDFLVRLRRERTTQVWTLLWVPLIVLWCIYFGFQIDNLATSVEDKSFQVILRKQDTLPLPAWTICSDTNSSIVQVQCQKDGGPLLVQNKYGDGCFGFNEKPPVLTASPGKGNIDCVIGFQASGQSAQVFLHDPIYSADIHDPASGQLIYDILKQVPSGICVTDVQQGQKTFFWWRWNRYEFFGHGSDKINTYSEVSSSVINHVSTVYNHSASLRLEVGDYYQWRFYEVQWWSGYDFWYFIGFMGGASFLFTLIHTILYYAVVQLILKDQTEYLNLEEGSHGQVSRPMTDMSSRNAETSSSSSSGTTYDTI